MLSSPRVLLDRWRHGPGRADELVRLRARFAAQPGRSDTSAAQVGRATELRRLRVQMLRLLGSPRACARCARGHPLPAGRFPGGHCCSGSTLVLFSVDEVAALKLAGTRPGRLEVPRTEQCGCAFRGPTGCSLDPADRPSICARYVCLALRQELTRAGAWLLVAEVGRALRDCFAAFVADRGSVMVAPCG